MLGSSFEVYDSAADGFILRFLKSKNKCVLRKRRIYSIYCGNDETKGRRRNLNGQIIDQIH